MTRCDNCAPEFQCFDGSSACCKVTFRPSTGHVFNYVQSIRGESGVPPIVIGANPCPRCHHSHAGVEAAFICIRCPCEYRPCNGSGRDPRVSYCGEVREAPRGPSKVYESRCPFCDVPYEPGVPMPSHWIIPVDVDDIKIVSSGKVLEGIEPAPCDGDHPAPRCASAQCWHRDPRAGDVKAPTIVVLCGSTRFYDAFQRANFEETMAGRIVLSVGFFHPDAPPGSPPGTAGRYMANRFAERHGEDVGITPDQKLALDELHKRKIDLADEVFVLNVDGYIGSSTRSAIEYARSIGKPIRWLVDVCPCCGEPLGDGDLATTQVSLDDGSENQTWHLSCAQAHAEETP